MGLSLFKNMTLQMKLGIISVLFILIPLTIVGLFLNISSEKYVAERMDKDTLQTLHLVKENVDLLLQNYETQIQSIYQQEEMIRKLYMDVTDAPYLIDKSLGNESIHFFLRKFIRNNDEIESIYLFPKASKGLYFLDYKGSTYFLDQYRKHPEWEKMINSSKGKVVWLSTYRDQPNRYRSQDTFYFLGGSQIRNIFNVLEPLGTIVFSVRMEALNKIIENIEISKHGFILLVDRQGKVIWHENEAVIGQKISNIPAFQQMVSGKKEVVLQKLDGKLYRTSFLHSNYSNWYYMAFVPMSDISDETKNMKKYMYITIFIILIIFSLIAWMLTYFITHPLRRLVVAMHSFDPTDPQTKLGTGARDEMGVLHEAFNQMSDRINQLIEEKKLLSTKEKEAELKALQAQINPHFVYNTLDVTNWLAIEKNEQEISKMIIALSDIMRYTINQGRKWVTIQEELQWVEKYVYIQRTRFEDRFDVRVEVEDQVLSCKIPHLLFQPFIENAIIHGMEERDAGGLIAIRVRKEPIANQIKIQIQDNGLGMSKSILEQIDGRANSGIGIHNVNDRLQLAFGQEYGVEIDSNEGEGTTVTIMVPYINQHDEIRGEEWE